MQCMYANGNQIPTASGSQPTQTPSTAPVVSENSGRAVVVPQQPAQPLAAANVGAPEQAGLGRDQLVAGPLMVPLPIVVRHELVEHAEQAVLSEQDEAVRPLLPHRAHEALRVGVGYWAPGRASARSAPPRLRRCGGIPPSTWRPGHR